MVAEELAVPDGVAEFVAVDEGSTKRSDNPVLEGASGGAVVGSGVGEGVAVAEGDGVGVAVGNTVAGS